MIDTLMVESRLSEFAAATAGAVRAVVPAGEPRAHLYELVEDYPSRGGKAIRPALCLATCLAFGGSEADALPTAAAIELLHNAFLVHDDIEDGSLRRRGDATLHARHGVPLALNAGDALAAFALSALRTNHARLGSRLSALVAAEFDQMMTRTVEGQAMELGWRRDNVVTLSPDDYLDLIMRKTCWYTTIHPLRTGALIGSWGRADLAAMVRFGFYLGAAFQIHDDVLNIDGTDEGYGKEWCGDLYEGKRTLMVIHLLSVLRGRERDEFVEFLGIERGQRSDAQIGWARDLMVSAGSVHFAREFARGIADAAIAAFDVAFAAVRDTPDARFVRDLVDWMVARTR